MKKPIAVCLVTNNLYWETKYTIENLLVKTKLKVKLYIVDNASANPKTIELGREFCKKTKGNFFTLEHPQKIVSALNIALKHVKEEQCVIFPINYFVNTNWLEELIHFESKIINVGALGIRCQHEKINFVPILHENVHEMEDKLEHTWINPSNIVEGLFLINSKIIERVGILDENLKNTGAEFMEWMFRISASGYQNVYIRNQFAIKLDYIENLVIFPKKSKAALDELKTEAERLILIQNFKK